MTPEEVSLVEESWSQISACREPIAAIFYTRLFDRNPALRPLFRGNLKEQRRKLMRALAQLVSELRDPGALTDSLERLGLRHRGYGVGPEHYQDFGEALLWTLRSAIGTAFTEEIEKAWAQFWGELSTAMLNAEEREPAA